MEYMEKRRMPIEQAPAVQATTKQPASRGIMGFLGDTISTAGHLAEKAEKPLEIAESLAHGAISPKVLEHLGTGGLGSTVAKPVQAVERALGGGMFGQVFGAMGKAAGIASTAAGAVDNYRDSTCTTTLGKVTGAARGTALDYMMAETGLSTAGMVAKKGFGIDPTEVIKGGANAYDTMKEAALTGNLKGLNKLEDKMTRDEGMTGLIYNGSKALTDPQAMRKDSMVGMNHLQKNLHDVAGAKPLVEGSEYLANQGWGSVYGAFGRNARQAKSMIGGGLKKAWNKFW